MGFARTRDRPLRACRRNFWDHFVTAQDTAGAAYRRRHRLPVEDGDEICSHQSWICTPVLCDLSCSNVSRISSGGATQIVRYVLSNPSHQISLAKQPLSRAARRAKPYLIEMFS